MNSTVTNTVGVEPPWTGGRIGIVSDDVDKRLYLSTVVASIWSEAEIIDVEPDDELVVRSCEVVLVHDGSGIAIDWMERHANVQGIAIIVVAAQLDDAFTARVLKLGAMDCVFEGSGYPGNLIHALRNEAERTVRKRGKVAAPSRPSMDAETPLNGDLDGDDDHTVSGVLLFRSKGRQILPGVGADSLGAEVAAQVYADGAEVISSKVLNGALRIHVDGMIGLIHAEMIAAHVADLMRDRNTRVGQDGAVALGMAVSDFGGRASLATLTRKAEILCDQIRLEGGEGIKVATCQDIKEADAPAAGDAGVDATEGEVDLLQEGIRAVLMAGQLQVAFEPLRGNDARYNEVQREQAVIKLIDRNGDPWIAERRDKLLSMRGHATSVDRIVVAHTLRRLRADKSEKLAIVLDLSAESMLSAQFWRWLAQRLGSAEAMSSASRLSLTLSLEVLRKRHIDPNFLVRFGIARGCHFVLRDIGDVKEALDFAQIVPIQFFALDMHLRRGKAGCDSIKKAVRALHAANRRVALRYIHASADLFCAYSSGADFYHGQLADQWEEVGLQPLDGGSSRAAEPTWLSDFKG